MFLTAFWLRQRIWQLLRMSRFMKIGSLGTLFDGDFKDPKWTLSQYHLDSPTKNYQHNKSYFLQQ